MKKRSLFVATAMLLVAVIACTSATYAWFISNSTASVEALNVGVTADGGILISATGEEGSWKTSLTKQEINEAAKGVIPDGLDPYDFNPTSGTIYAAAIEGNSATWSAQATTPTKFVAFPIYIKSTTGNCTIKLTGSSMTTTAGGGYVYSALKIGDAAYKVFSISAGNTYYPFSGNNSTPATLQDDMTVDEAHAQVSADVVTSLAQSAIAAETFQIVDAGTPTQILVRMWAEGQDPECDGLHGNDDATLTLAFMKQVEGP